MDYRNTILTTPKTNSSGGYFVEICIFDQSENIQSVQTVDLETYISDLNNMTKPIM